MTTPTTAPEAYLTSSEAAKYLGMAEGHLRNLRSQGRGPKFYRNASRRIGYKVADLDAWSRYTFGGGMR